jgi:hypothetical protein
MSTEATDLGLRRARRITAEEVFAAADALVMSGHRPTIDRVRIQLGRGSPNTINEHLDRWWRGLGARLQGLPASGLQQFPEAVATSLQQLWTVALREAQVVLEASLEQRERALLAAQEEFDQQRIQLTARESAWIETRTALERAQAAAQQQAEITRLRADELATTMAQREVQLTGLEAQLEHARGQIDTLRQRLQQETAARVSDRQVLEERSAATEAHGLREIDRARQQCKEDLKQAASIEKTLRAELQAQRQAREAGDKHARTLEQRILTLESVAQERARQLERLQGPPAPRPPRTASAKRSRRSRLSRKL